MARSAHAYVRGNTAKFYEWLEAGSDTRLPHGPPIWICGDCHADNLGPIADSEGHIEIQIRDLDQTVIGNPAHDLVRLGLSLASAARGSDLPGVTTAQMIEQMVEGYECSFDIQDDKVKEYLVRPRLVEAAMRNALKRKWRHLARERIEDTSPRIPLGKRFWPLSKKEETQIHKLMRDEQIRRLFTSRRSSDENSQVEMVDAAYWVKGCSSLGRLRYAVLSRLGGQGGPLCLST